VGTPGGGRRVFLVLGIVVFSAAATLIAAFWQGFRHLACYLPASFWRSIE
jgi:hypothetical protein